MVMKTAHIKKGVLFKQNRRDIQPNKRPAASPRSASAEPAALRLREKTQLHEIMQSRSISMETERTGRMISISFLGRLHHGHI